MCVCNQKRLLLALDMIPAAAAAADDDFAAAWATFRDIPFPPRVDLISILETIFPSLLCLMTAYAVVKRKWGGGSPKGVFVGFPLTKWRDSM